MLKVCPPGLKFQSITDVLVPTSLSIWDFLFESGYSPLKRLPEGELAGFFDAVTKERIRYDAVKEYTTYVSTALVKEYGLQPGETVALFSPNTIWYPVAMLGTVRAGTGRCHSGANHDRC